MRTPRIGLEALENRRLFAVTTGTVRGIAYVDSNGNGTHDALEGTPPTTHIYIDANNNGALDPGEPSARISEFGHYHFDDVEHGTYHIRVKSVLGFTPEQTDGYNVTVFGGKTVRRAFPILEPGTIHGRVFVDTNRNGIRDPGEPLAAKQQAIFLDLDDDGKLDRTEPLDETTIGKNYRFLDVAPGRYEIRILMLGQTFTTPHAFSTIVRAGESVNKDFGVAP